MTSPAVRAPRVTLERVVDDLFEISADALVNPWNRNYVPRSLCRPGGVSGQLRKRTGEAPWIDLARHGTLRVGQAVQTGAGNSIGCPCSSTWPGCTGTGGQVPEACTSRPAAPC